ncbi:MAG: hypothetical protein ABIP39_08785, partial [Polyangiaceae bacterium]
GAGATFVAWSFIAGNRLRFACAITIAAAMMVTGRFALRSESDDFMETESSTTRAHRGAAQREEERLGNSGGFGSSAPTAPWGRDLREAAEFGMIGLLAAPDGLHDGMRDGMRPVAIALPSSERTVSASRDLVTGERPFRPTLYYVTDGAVVLVAVGWLACLIGLAFAYRVPLVRFRDRLRRSGGDDVQLDRKEPYFAG